MAKCCVVFSQSPFEDLIAFRVRHVLLLVSILTSNAPGQWYFALLDPRGMNAIARTQPFFKTGHDSLLLSIGLYICMQVRKKLLLTDSSLSRFVFLKRRLHLFYLKFH